MGGRSPPGERGLKLDNLKGPMKAVLFALKGAIRSRSGRGFTITMVKVAQAQVAASGPAKNDEEKAAYTAISLSDVGYQGTVLSGHVTGWAKARRAFRR